MFRDRILLLALAAGIPLAAAAQDVEIFNNGNKARIDAGTARSPLFRLQEPTLITRIVNYHWLGAGREPGTIGFVSQDGRRYGPWPAAGTSGSGQQKVNWVVSVNVTLPAGTYAVLDSDPSTWSFNAGSNGIGFSQIFARPPDDVMPSPQATGSFAGTWDSNFNRMELQQTGNRVLGSYAHAGGRIEGVVSGNVMRGKWTQTNGQGEFVFQLAADGRSFAGTWGYNATSGGGDWKGTRVGGGNVAAAPAYAPPPAPTAPSYAPPQAPSSPTTAASFSGTWESTFNRMSLSQRGNRVTGTYEHADGRIDGVVSGNELRGTWTQSNGKGLFVLRMAPDGMSFDGTWGSNAESTGGGWKGTRVGGSPEPQPPVYAAPSAPSVPTSRPVAPSVGGRAFAGTWDTDFKRMSLTVSGDRVTGSYEHSGGRIEGVLRGDVIRGTWTQTNGRGGFVWQLSADGNSFSGTWGMNASESGGGAWRGTRVGPAPAGEPSYDAPAAVPVSPGAAASGANFAGTWDSDFKRMTLSQSGNRVWGSYEHAGGRVEGILSGGELRGTWTQTNGKGRFVFRMAADGQSFVGSWGNGEAETGSQWNGRKVP